MTLRLSLVLAITVFSGCDIHFVGVGEVQQGSVFLRSEHADGVEASLEVSLPRTGQAAPLVLLGDDPLQGEAEDSRWSYRTELVVDTLQPRFELEIRTDDVVVAPLPFVTRNGPAIRRQNGDLELSVTYGGEASDSQHTWRVVLVDSNGQHLTTVISRSAPLPSLIVLSNALVPATAATAEMTVSRHHLSDGIHPVDVLTESVVRVPIANEL